MHPTLIPSSRRDSSVPTKSAKELFGELSQGQMEDLVQVYKEDFEIHGYNPYSVLHWIWFFHCLTNIVLDLVIVWFEKFSFAFECKSTSILSIKFYNNKFSCLYPLEVQVTSV